MNLPRILPITPESLPALEAAALLDRHRIVFPTHQVMRNGDADPIGYISINGAPTVFTWFDSHKLVARESFGLINSIENVLRFAGQRNMITTCAPGSPFRPVMESMGYAPLGTVDLFAKPL